MSATVRSRPAAGFELVVLVASFGGLAPTSAVLSGLPRDFPVPIVLVQHRTSEEPQRLAAVLGSRTALDVRTAPTGPAALQPGVTVIPGRRSATLDVERRLRLTAGRGTVGDPLLTSAAAVLGPGLIAVVLSGMQRDGTVGARAVKFSGGRVLAQDPATAGGTSMPTSTIATGCVDFVLSPSRIAAALVALAMAPGAAEFLTVALPPWARMVG